MNRKSIYSINKKLKISTIYNSTIKVIKWIALAKKRKSMQLINQNRLIRYSNLLAFSIENIIFSKKMQQLKDRIKLIKYNSTTIKIDYQKIYEEWKSAQCLWTEGHYKDSCALNKKCLEKIYLSKSIDENNHVPTYLSYEWCSAYGHLGLLGAFLIAQDKNLISQKKRTLHVYTNEQVGQINLLFQDKINVVKSAWKSSMLERPSKWHLSERLMMVKSSESFIPLYELLEKTYSSKTMMGNEPSLHLTFDYEANAREKLIQLGIPEEAWFVGFHIREKLDKFDPRYASLNSFLPSLKEIVRNGGWVIRFGTGKMEPIVGVKNVLDLNLDNPENRFLHFYILANSRFILSTNSGPAALAWAFGTPVLQTNTTSIARNIITASRGTIWLPKIYFYKGSRCSFARLVDSLEGYSETNLKEKEKLGFKLLENTEDEILEATKDMLRGAESINKSNSNVKLKKIREHFNVIGYGKIAPSFLDKHERWFLS